MITDTPHQAITAHPTGEWFAIREHATRVYVRYGFGSVKDAIKWAIEMHLSYSVVP